MLIGTPGFVGERLREAREARGLSGVDLADMLGVTPQTVYAYQSSEGVTPSPQVMDAISKTLNFPPAFFMKRHPPEDKSGVFWRSNNSATRVARLRAEARLVWLKELLAYLKHFFDFPTPNIPNNSLPKNFRQITNTQIEAVALSCRRAWGLGDGPLPDVVGEMETNGIITARIKVGADSLDAFSQWSATDDTPYVFLSTDKACGARMRFDAAHELGHLILHRHLDRKALSNSKDWKLIEDQAHRFASAFLMPAITFSKDVWAPSLDTFISLKQRWRVSAAAMIMRCQYLGLLNDDQAQRLWINRNRRGWRKSEPLDDKIQCESPSLVPKAIEMLVTENVRRKEQIATDMCLPAVDLEEIAGLPFGYFRTQPAQVVPIPKPQTFAPQSDDDDSDNVVELFGGKR